MFLGMENLNVTIESYLCCILGDIISVVQGISMRGGLVSPQFAAITLGFFLLDERVCSLWVRE